MAGHSHSANIAVRKGAQDKARSKLFTKLTKEIMVAARLKGGDPASNPRLRLAIEKARGKSMPKDNIQRAVDRATGNIEGANYESLSMEGYGPGGVAVMCEVLTDNRNRAASEVRHAFAKGGGNLGTTGCVGYLFQRLGVVLVTGCDEDTVMEAALEAGAEDVTTEDDGFEVITSPEEFDAVHEALRDSGLTIGSAEVMWIPGNRVAVAGGDAQRLLRMLERLDNCEDVQHIHHNAEFSQSDLARFQDS